MSMIAHRMYFVWWVHVESATVGIWKEEEVDRMYLLVRWPLLQWNAPSVGKMLLQSTMWWAGTHVSVKHHAACCTAPVYPRRKLV